MQNRRLGVLLAAVLGLVCPRVWAQDQAPAAKAPPGGADATVKDAPGPGSTPDPASVAPTISGASGLFRVVTADVGSPHTFRVGLHAELLKASEFLVCTRTDSAGNCTAGDDNSRFAGTLGVSYTPWPYLEIFANFRSQANSNVRDDANRIDQEVILALGDFGIGAKGRVTVAKGLSVGANFSLDFLNSVGGVSIDGNAASFYIGALASLDLQPLVDAPLRFHLNTGFRLDNSNELARFTNYPLPSLQVEKFALGINPSRLLIRTGADFELRRWVGFGLRPLMELNFSVATGDSDKDFDDPRFLRPNGPLTAGDIEGRATISMTLGVRASPLRGLNIDLGTDVGLVSPGYGFGPPVIPWNVILGFSYGYDASRPVRVVTRERIKKVVVAAKPKESKLRGRIINGTTLEPVEGAVVTFPGRDLTGLSSDPDGGFLSYDFPPGKLAVVVRHPDYDPAKVMADVAVGTIVQLDVKMTPSIKVGKVLGKLVDLKNSPVLANIDVTGPENRQVRAGTDGAFDVELKPGSYSFRFTADGFLAKESRVQVTAGATAQLNLTLSPKPRRSLVRLTKRSIRIRRKVHFATGTATLLPDSRQLLDEVVDVLVRNPTIQVQIQGHTDSRGSARRNMMLSQQRAEAVRDYCVRNGVDAGRLTAKGLGSSRPKVPNITARNRARNRRVEFRITSR